MPPSACSAARAPASVRLTRCGPRRRSGSAGPGRRPRTISAISRSASASPRRAREHQRHQGLVDQHRVGLVDQQHVGLGRDQVRDVVAQPVAQHVEAELADRRVGHLRRVGLPPLGGRRRLADAADRDAEQVVDRPHPLGVPPGQVVVDRHDVHRAAAAARTGPRPARRTGSCPPRWPSRPPGRRAWPACRAAERRRGAPPARAGRPPARPRRTRRRRPPRLGSLGQRIVGQARPGNPRAAAMAGSSRW